MKVFCKELNKHFDTTAEMLKELSANESKIVELKKAAIKETDSVNFFISIPDAGAEKALNFIKEGFVYPVINTTNFLDSHGDVHFPNLWNKTLKDKVNKIFYVLEHKLSIDNVIAYPNDVRAFVKNMPWSDLNLPYEGETQALIFEIAKDKIRIPKVKDLFSEMVSFENSVRMRYISIALAAKSDDEGLAKQNQLWKDRIDLVVNKEAAEAAGYFWAIDEASVEKEGSLVLFGSNSATPVLYQKENEAAEGTSKIEPEESTQNGVEKNYFNLNL